MPGNPDDEKIFTQLNESIVFQLQQLANHGSLTMHAALLITPQQGDSDVPSNEPLYGEIKARLKSVQLLPAAIVPQAVKDARGLMASKEKFWADQKKTLANQLHHINALIGKANGALKTGESRQAAGIRRSLAVSYTHLTLPTSDLE